MWCGEIINVQISSQSCEREIPVMDVSVAVWCGVVVT